MAFHSLTEELCKHGNCRRVGWGLLVLGVLFDASLSDILCNNFALN